MYIMRYNAFIAISGRMYIMINLFGVRYQRSPDVDWFENPHEAVARCRAINSRKIIWLCYDSDRVHPHYNSKAWQTVWNLADFERRTLPGFAPASSPAWIAPDKLPGATREN